MNHTKRCTKCQGEFPATLEFFHKHSRGKYGLKAKCKNCCKAYKRDHYKKYKTKIREYNKQYYELNGYAKLEYQKEYYRLNRDARVKYQMQYNKNRHHSDPHFKIKKNLSSRMQRFFSKNGDRTIDFIGCSIDDLKLHLEKQFTDGMSWENYGDWHVDHIRPCCSFDLTDPEQQRECFNYTNLQPLWARDNLAKSGRYEFPHNDE